MGSRLSPSLPTASQRHRRLTDQVVTKNRRLLRTCRAAIVISAELAREAIPRTLSGVLGRRQVNAIYEAA
jgi:hypothetical protein